VDGAPGRRAIGIDIDPQWVEASIARLHAEDAMSNIGDVKRGQEALFGIPEGT
jgi:hypothetical protein